MILIAAFLIGAAVGALRARARGGAAGDMVHYALAHGLAAVVLAAAAALVAALAGFSPL